MTPMFERAKTVHALDRAATIIGASIRATRNVAAKLEGLKFRSIEQQKESMWA
jgi:hypothetical protein